jgi:S-adenosylmethionine synthetase
MGRQPMKVEKTFKDGSGKTKTIVVELFPWEKEDYTAQLKKAFGL